MKALLLDRYEHFSLVDRPSTDPSADEVLIEVGRCGICGSDVHGFDGTSGRRLPPVVMGHEASGTIESIGSEVAGLRPGDNVTFDSTVSCGNCSFCLSGRLNLCSQRRVLGVSCDEYRRDGAFAEYLTIPARGVYKFPDSLTLDAAAFTEPLSIALHAVELAGSLLGRKVVVFGAGVIGALSVCVARAGGCSRLVSIDPDESRRHRVMELGCDHAVDPTGLDDGELAGRVGFAADVVIDAVGVPATVAGSIELVERGGIVVLVGNITAGVEFNLQTAVTRELTIHGSCGSAGEYERCIDMLDAGIVKTESMISAVAPLEEAASWFERLHSKEEGLLKVLIAPNA